MKKQNLDQGSEKPKPLKTLQQDNVQFRERNYSQSLKETEKIVGTSLFMLLFIALILGVVSNFKGGVLFENYLYKILPFLIALAGGTFAWGGFYTNVGREKFSHTKELLVELDCSVTKHTEDPHQLKVENIGVGTALEVAVTLEHKVAVTHEDVQPEPRSVIVIKSVLGAGRKFEIRLGKTPYKRVVVNFKNIDGESLPPIILLPDEQ